MLTDPSPASLELLVVGGLTVDSLDDGTQAAGGSVIYATRGMHLAGRSVGVLTLAGPEPAAVAGLAELRRLASPVHVQPAGCSIGFTHDETGPIRVLTFTASAGRLAPAALEVEPAAVLYAPVADELGPDPGQAFNAGAHIGACLQGWLRSLQPGEPVRPLPVAAIPALLADWLAEIDLIVASVDDLRAESTRPRDQLLALRRRVGPRPTLVVTVGVDGAWLQVASGAVTRVDPGRIVRDVPTVGAGDAYAAILLADLVRGLAAEDAARDAGDVVAELLARRRPHSAGEA
jgi:sugar/nucleoside kinase (ribokinase family)